MVDDNNGIEIEKLIFNVIEWLMVNEICAVKIISRVADGTNQLKGLI